MEYLFSMLFVACMYMTSVASVTGFFVYNVAKKMKKKIRGMYRDALRFVISHKFLHKTIGNTRWFCHLVDIEAKMIIRGQ